MNYTAFGGLLLALAVFVNVAEARTIWETEVDNINLRARDFADFCNNYRGHLNVRTMSLPHSFASTLTSALLLLGGQIGISEVEVNYGQDPRSSAYAVALAFGRHNEIAEKLIKSYKMNSGDLKTSQDNGVEEACSNIRDYYQDLRQQFDETEAKIGSGVKLEDLGCYTTNRVLLINHICEFGKMAKESSEQTVIYKPLKLRI